MLDPTHLLPLAAQSTATTTDLVRDADQDKENASPREDVTPSVPADLQFLKEKIPNALAEKFAMAKEHVSPDHPRSKQLNLFFFYRVLQQLIFYSPTPKKKTLFFFFFFNFKSQ
jgi:hypothetical protein